MTQSKPPEDDTLDAAFAALRETPPRVPDALVTRVMADALAEMPQSKQKPVWRQVLSHLGGWPAIAGLAATACVGLWTGGVLSDDVMVTFGFSESASLEFGDTLGAFDLLLVDG